MKSTNPRYPVKVQKILGLNTAALTHVVRSCPRCGVNIGINLGMYNGIESIICKGRRVNATNCNGHFYLNVPDGPMPTFTGNRLVERRTLEFVGTVKDKPWQKDMR